ncbi:tyrosine-type recombinase/integrase [Lacticaseibacillus paracasei]|uniref:tyrosine-type recombinase/integrase n=1 Tax=Lacticaseibacillus paracasei TaxID=1597 RepID=UPI0022E93D0D|nr:tyrosine-type recombinase/integrase [Lacticaseibacillus paracasei]
MASIKPYQSKGQTLYRVQIYAGIDPLTGKKRYRSRQGIKTKQEANLVAKRLEYAALEGHSIKKAEPVTFKELSDEYFEAYKVTVRVSTSDNLKASVDKHLIPAIGEYRVNAITTATMQKVANQLSKDIPSVTDRLLQYARSVFKLAMHKRIISEDPTTWVKRPKHQTVHKDDNFLYWDKDQIAKFFSCIDREKQLDQFVFFKLLFLAGLRRGEALALNWSDITFAGEDEVDIDVNKTVAKKLAINPPKTPASYRTVPVFDRDTVDALHAWRIKQQEKMKYYNVNTMVSNDFPILCNHKGTTLNLRTPRVWLLKLMDDNHLEPRITLHKARHSFISNLLLAGVPVPTVQKLAGHDSPDITLAVYAHVNAKQRENAAKTLSKYLSGDDKVDSGKDSGESNGKK